MNHVLIRCKIKPEKKERVFEFLKEFFMRERESRETLVLEACHNESFFVHEDELFIYKEVEDLEKSREVQKMENHALYDAVFRMREECLGERTIISSKLTLNQGKVVLN